MSTTKSRFINHILELNASADSRWLERFKESELEAYLAHLQHSQEPRGGQSFWERPGGVKPVVTRRPAA